MKADEKDKAAKAASKAVSKASSPGAVAVAEDEASRLDQRIADKQRRTAASATKPPSSPVAKPAPKPASVGTSIGKLDSDIAAKQRGRGNKSASKPGAYAENSVVGVQPSRGTVESDVASKTRLRISRVPSTPDALPASRVRGHDISASIPRSSPNDSNVTKGIGDVVDSHAVSSQMKLKAPPSEAAHVPQSLEAKVAAKIRNESSLPSTAAPSTVPGVFSQLRNLEDSVAAKVRRENQSSGVTAQVSNTQDSVGKKIRRETSSSSRHIAHAVPSALKSLEDKIAAKVRGEVKQFGAGELSRLEDAVSMKLRNERSAGVQSPAEKNGMIKLNANKGNVDSTVTSTKSGIPQGNHVSSEGLGTQRAASDVALLDARIAAKTANMTGLSSKDTPKDVGSSVASEKEDHAASKDKNTEKPIAEHAPMPAKERLNTSKLDVTKDEKDKVPKDEHVKQGSGTGQNGLAIAVPIDEELDDAFIPAAIEYDPDAKPPMYKNRRFRLYGFLALFVIFLASIAAAIGGTLANKNNGIDIQAPTPAPTSFREALGIEAQILRLVGSEKLEDPESPYSKALEWITFDDPMQITPEDENFIQRYTAAYLYFATTEDGPWRSCNPPKDPWKDDSACEYEKLSGVFPLRFTKVPWHAWLSNIHECDWAGITCDDEDKIRTIDNAAGGMSGPFPEGIYNWPFLQSISFMWNNLRGKLPAELVEMKHLINIEVHYNMFTGTIPDEWWMARNMQRINLGDNMLSGTISSAIQNLQDMKGIFAFSNLLTGSLPESIGAMDSLTYFRMSRNSLEGHVPSSIANWKWCAEFWVHLNRMSGPIPANIGDISTMMDLRMSSNNMTGTLPDSLWNLPTINRIDLAENQLSGTLSSKISNVEFTLETLYLSQNKFDGPIPSEFGSLFMLYDVTLDGNAFTGSIPDSFCFFNSSIVLMDEFVADCAPDDDGNLELDCSCCTHCCNPEGNDCLPTDVNLST